LGWELWRARQQKGELENQVDKQRRKVRNLVNKGEHQEREIKDLRKETAGEQSRKAGVVATIGEQGRRTGGLEGESHRKRGTILRHGLGIEDFQDAKKKCKDELNRSVRRELEQLKEGDKVIRAKGYRVVRKVGKLKVGIRQDEPVKKLTEVETC
jgi:chromosome segregation ATPase